MYTLGQKQKNGSIKIKRYRRKSLYSFDTLEEVTTFIKEKNLEESIVPLEILAGTVRELFLAESDPEAFHFGYNVIQLIASNANRAVIYDSPDYKVALSVDMENYSLHCFNEYDTTYEDESGTELAEHVQSYRRIDILDLFGVYQQSRLNGLPLVRESELLDLIDDYDCTDLSEHNICYEGEQFRAMLNKVYLNKQNS